MNESITSFLQDQTCATICCTDDEGNPYCFNCYYVLNKEKGLMYFKSSSNTHHHEFLKKKRAVAGTVLPDKLSKLVTKGIQFGGELLQQSNPIAKDAYIQYHKKYAMALAMKGEIFTILLHSIKMTDSNLGFGKKINWLREIIAIS